VDVLVNSAGLIQLATIAAGDDAFFDRRIAVDSKAAFNGLSQTAKRLRPHP
jgi:3-oxoacyl-[acyl-carrier protein] reductase